ncbi:hypothetical protein L195_g037811 [Trifolium pratense]|uniref:Uncharacterized protein n=1 Tax=Trifolium pratense TaxID=57577 RepID=A0A2K3LTC3_TRIPR|nr:hypothetical protein L195_g037811 [Trifolium pratense]
MVKISIGQGIKYHMCIIACEIIIFLLLLLKQTKWSQGYPSWLEASMHGWIKLNSDGSCRDNGIAGCGGIIWESDGEWYSHCAKNIEMCSDYMTELWGVLEETGESDGKIIYIADRMSLAFEVGCGGALLSLRNKPVC